MIKLFNANSIRTLKEKTRVSPRGFRYGYVENLFHEPVYQELIRTFPDVTKFELVDKVSGGGRKHFYVGPKYVSNRHGGCVCHMDALSPVWKDVLRESTSEELTALLSEAIGIAFNSVALFGFTFGKEGCVQEPHIDGAVGYNEEAENPSTFAGLIYFNKEPGGVGGTCIYDTDRKTVIFQAPHLRNALFFFEQHPDAWHGFPLMPKGAERRLVSLAYGQEKSLIHLKESLLHRATCKLTWKSRVRKILGRA